MGGPPYEPLQQAYEMQPMGDSPSMMQSQYPAGPAMSTFGGGTAFGGAPPAHGGMAAMETSGFTKAGEGHGHGGDGGHGSEHGGHEKIDDGTGMAPRRCTDVQTCFCWLVVVIISFTILLAAKQHGNIGRLTRGTDYYGRVCGVDPGVENLPFLFWCRSDPPSAASPADLDLDHPTCVPYCPTTNNPSITMPCLLAAQNVESEIEGGQFGNVRTQQVSMQETIVKSVAYATRPRGGRFCIPLETRLEEKVLSDSRALGPWGYLRWLVAWGTLSHLYWLLLCASLLTLLLGYGFLFCIRHCPYYLAKTALYPLVLLMFLGTVWWCLAIVPMIDKTAGFSEWYIPRNDIYKHWDFEKANWISILTGLVCFSIGGAFFGLAWNFKSIGITDLMNCAFETFRAIPGMPYVPIFEGLAKFLVFWVGVSGFQIILAEGWIEKNRIHVNGAKFAGLSRDFVPSLHDPRFYFMAAAWLFLTYWMLEFVTGLGQFVTSYATFKYFGIKKEKGKKPKAEGGIVCSGLKLALIYHPGSILRGALLTPLYRPIRILHWFTAEFGDEGGDQNSALNRIIKCLPCCWCCGAIQAWTKDALKEGELHHGDIQDIWCKDGFSDVVVRANDFDKGCEKAHELLEHSHKITQFLYRDHSQTTMNLIGVGSVATACSATVYLLVVNLDIYKESTSPLFVADPYLVVLLTWILSAYIAFGFMTLWDHTADSLLYCYAWARRWNRKTVDQYIPESLRFIVGFDDVEGDRYPYYGKAKNNMYLRTWLPMVGMEDPKKKKASDDRKDASKARTQLPGGSVNMQPRPNPSQADGSWMSGFGTGFGQFGRQQEAISGEQSPLLQ